MSAPTIKLNNGKEVSGEWHVRRSGEQGIDRTADAACGVWSVEGEQRESSQSFLRALKWA